MASSRISFLFTILAFLALTQFAAAFPASLGVREPAPVAAPGPSPQSLQDLINQLNQWLAMQAAIAKKAQDQALGLI